MIRPRFLALAALVTVAVGAVTIVGISSFLTEREIEGHRVTVGQIARNFQPASIDPAAMQALPAPVRRYLEFAVPDTTLGYRVVNIAEEGGFPAASHGRLCPDDGLPDDRRQNAGTSVRRHDSHRAWGLGARL